VVKRDVINGESCYQENGEEVRREEARVLVRVERAVFRVFGFLDSESGSRQQLPRASGMRLGSVFVGERVER